MISGYDAFEDPYAYPGTSVLKNILDIRDAHALEEYEVEISSLRPEEPLPLGDFDPLHYRNVHHHLFQDVYLWAGQYRTVRTSKGGNPFCYPEYISDEMDRLFWRFENGQKFADLPSKEFVHLAAEFIGELNVIHPFREGNGRAQLAFLGLIGLTFGHPFRFDRLNRETFLPAIIHSYFAQRNPLIEELQKLLT